MTKTAAIAFEVRWRKNDDPDGQWSSPVGVDADGHVIVPGLERVTDYIFEARAISGCGAKSAWATQTFNLPDVPAGTLTLAALSTEIDNAAADATAANAALANIANDNLLSPAEKPTVERDYTVITTEQSGIDAQATAYSITTEKTAYDSAVSALTTYLATLTTATAWNDKSGYTTIVGTTFRSKFNTVYTTRQTLLNAIYAAAQGLANGAQTTANIAQSALPIVNPNFVDGLAGWSPDAAGWTANSTSATSPNPQITTFAEYYRSGFSGNGGLYNNTVNPCQAGDRFTATGQILANGGTGNAHVGIAWFNSSKSLIISSFGNAITGSTTGTSRIVGTAPAGAVYCEAVCAVLNYTGSGAYTFTGVTLTAQPNTLNETPDGTSRFAVVNGGGFKGVSSVDVNNRAGIDFTQSLHIGRHLGNIPDDPTSTRYAVANIDGNRRALVDFSQAAHLNKTQDYIGDGTTYLRAPSTTGSAVQVDNANFQQGADAQGNIPGWSPVSGSVTISIGSPGPATGTNLLNVHTTTVSNTGAHTNKRYSCNPGDTFWIQSWIFVNTAGSSCQACVNFYNSGGGYLGQVAAVLSAAGGWVQKNASGVAPTGAVYAEIWLQNNNTNTSGLFSGVQVTRAANLDYEAVDGTTHGRIAMADVYQVSGVNRVGLRVAGSGHTIGDQRNLMPVTWAGVRSVLSASPITFSITSGSPNSTVNFSVAAVSLYAGSVTVSYNASSGSHAQVNGTTATYYLFYRDATGAGGSQTLYITVFPQTLAQYNDAVLIGSCDVTVASGGGGSGGTGGGGGGYCVADSMFIRDGHLAGDAEIGDPFDCIDLPTAAGKHVRALQGVTRGTEECVRMITSDGCALVCSVSTPFDLPGGSNTTALHMLGEQVITDLGTAIVTSLALVGPQPVTRANLGGVSYAAGSDPQRRIYSHNATSKP